MNGQRTPISWELQDNLLGKLPELEPAKTRAFQSPEFRSALLRRKDQKIILPVVLRESLPPRPLIPSLAHLPLHYIRHNPMIRPIAVAIDNSHLRSRLQRSPQ